MFLNVNITLMTIDLDPLMQAISIFVLFHASIVAGPELLVQEKQTRINNARACFNKPNSLKKSTEILGLRKDMKNESINPGTNYSLQQKSQDKCSFR